MLIGIVAIDAAQANIATGGAAALRVKLLDADLTHIGAIRHIGHAVVAYHRLLVDPPIGVAALDADFFASFNIDHESISFTKFRYNHILLSGVILYFFALSMQSI